MTPTILIVEDDNMINNLIKEALENSDYKCIQAFSGTEGLLLIKTEKIDLVILDLMLPGKTGEEVIKEIKDSKNIPVIVVSAKDSIDSKVELLRSGADDYLTKPFDIKELEVRVEVRLRKYHEMNGSDGETGRDGSDNGTRTNASASEDNSIHSIYYKELELNPVDYYVKVNGNLLDLTKHEFRILELLVKNPSRAFSKQAIYDYAWDDVYIGEDKTINVHVSNIRKKLKAYTDTEYIDTVWGIGFKLKN